MRQLGLETLGRPFGCPVIQYCFVNFYMAPYAALRNHHGLMAYIVVLIITALNCVVLFSLSFMVVGDASPNANGIFQVWIFGFSWIALLSLVSLVLCAHGKRSTAVRIAFFTLPAGAIVALAGMPVVAALSSLKPSSPKLEAVCKDVGPRYIAKPASPVQSLAYDWKLPRIHPRSTISP